MIPTTDLTGYKLIFAPSFPIITTAIIPNRIIARPYGMQNPIGRYGNVGTFRGSIIILRIARNIGNHNWGFKIPTPINRTCEPNARRIIGGFAPVNIKFRPTQIQIASAFAILPFIHGKPRLILHFALVKTHIGGGKSITAIHASFKNNPIKKFGPNSNFIFRQMSQKNNPLIRNFNHRIPIKPLGRIHHHRHPLIHRTIFGAKYR